MSSSHAMHAALTSLFSSRLLVANVRVWATSPLGVMARRIICRFVFFFLQIMLPFKIPNSAQIHRWEDFLVFGNLSFMTSSPGWVSIPNSFVSLFIFYILPYLLSKRMGCLSGCLVSSACVQKLFCGICLAFKWSFNEFVGEKVVSPSYSSTILCFSKRKHLCFSKR